MVITFNGIILKGEKKAKKNISGGNRSLDKI